MSSYKTKLRAVGKSTGLILPKEMLDELHLGQGDEVYLRRENGHFVLSPYDPEVEAQIEAARQGMAQYRNTMKALAE